VKTSHSFFNFTARLVDGVFVGVGVRVGVVVFVGVIVGVIVLVGVKVGV
jgi:hypothetical protein